MSIQNSISRTKAGNALVATIFLFALLAFFSSLPAFETRADNDEDASTETREGRLAVFDDVWETINDRYYDPSFKGLDWKAPRNSFRRAAAEALGSNELYEVLDRMIAYLNDPHTRVYSPDEKSDWWQPRFVTVGMTIREIEGVPTVIRVEPGSSPARATIKPGDQIVSIDAVPVSEIISKKLGQLTSPPNKSARYRVAATLLDGEPGSSAQVLWRGKSGRLKAATFQRYLSQRELGYRIRRNDGYIVLEMQTFTRALVLEMVRELSAQLRGARGIILDLRSNGGGDAHAMASIASMFLGDGVALGKFTDRVGSNFELTTEARSLFVARAAAQTDIPMIALIGRSTSSAAEILASALQSRHRATLVGTGTCGCVLAIRSRHNLPDKGVLDVSEFDYRTAQGIRLEGLGVEPDDDSAPKRSDLYAKRDRSLETALEILKRNTKRQPLDTSLTR